MKFCTKCSKNKLENCFNRKGQKLQPYCRDCSNIYQKAHYRKHRDNYICKAKKHKRQIRNFIQNYKTGKPCVDCGGVFHFSAMDFDHTGLKKFGLASSSVPSINGAIEEISMCDLVCSNCHRIRTYNRRKTKPG